MTLLTPIEGLAILSAFGTLMLALVWCKSRKKQTSDTFLVADRDVSLIRASLSIAVSWIWAPAIFICSLQAYDKGLPGIFWFAAPNILCFFVFAPIAVRLRTLMPRGYTLPEFVYLRYGDKRTHAVFLCVFFLYQIGAIVINCVAGGSLLHMLCGLNVSFAITAMSGIAVAYSLLSGLKASIITDQVQMILVLLVALLLMPWVVFKAGGIATVTAGFAGVSGEFGNLFDPQVAYALGIPMTFGLIAGPISDQMFFQRAMAVENPNPPARGRFRLG